VGKEKVYTKGGPRGFKHLKHKITLEYRLKDVNFTLGKQKAEPNVDIQFPN
jgi:hypothetical protein